MTSVLAVVALALGIGLTTLMFSILNGAVLRGLPFERSERILHVAPFDIKESDDFEATQWEFAEWRARQTSFEDFTAFYVGNANVVGPDGTPERYRGAWVTPNTFRMLRTRSRAGPGLRRCRRRARRRAGRDRQRPGLARPLQEPARRARPAAAGQRDGDDGGGRDAAGLRVPHGAGTLGRAGRESPLEGKDARTSVEIIGRLRDDATRDQASAELATIAAQVASSTRSAATASRWK